MESGNTICAIATPPGQGGVAIIRISGKEALAIASRIYTPKAKNITTIEDQAAYTSSFGIIHKENEILDKVVVFVFRSPHSFTGEDTVEITCHGSIYIQQEIIKLLLDNGCHLARPGEFTQKAFLNGKMDLSQAESVIDLISSSSAAAHRLAFNQMRGGFGKKLKNLRFQLLRFVSLIELELDFEEDVEFVDRVKLLDSVLSIKDTLSHLIQSFSLGNAIKNGIPVVIIGETNVGKSTLLNHLLNEEKAIVSEIHGTTRDIIEDVINISGIAFRFIDTAGIRNTKNEIELLGIERTYQKIKKASIVIWMIDATKFNKEIKHIADRISPLIMDKKLIVIFNKIDKLNHSKQFFLKKKLPHISAEYICLSAKYKRNTDILEKTLLEAAKLSSLNYNDIIVTNMRHYEALRSALGALQRIEEGLKTNVSYELISQDIRECTHYLGEITGEISTDEILENIFKNFCIGK
ncbi:tRNA uridine-5-carboxymethylaminomethyl(34) synthesis GTPase MnmE [Candidatus Azobacteroides pseudotrichonymphae]|uniref:tRNA modification GTPase MnmE n=1 Tax=Azobacteroides pseudotrichonymphae genomovar. CFP2 TaxID=511995 RepID=B6YQQ0_AZOPC|nr:tRNA uridine-5-carboxymethylaminomethyl(34) synthesis GTPase MnmE [Candidatus Azobacteroides pseudotrichonymphae]BAG83522.1 tRNA modification GTPase [Candidatus Azobacteroides pseudotrichonymphae genomovar. CFP2]